MSKNTVILSQRSAIEQRRGYTHEGGNVHCNFKSDLSTEKLMVVTIPSSNATYNNKQDHIPGSQIASLQGREIRSGMSPATTPVRHFCYVEAVPELVKGELRSLSVFVHSEQALP